METSWNNAKFIKTDYFSHFDAKSPVWDVAKPRLYQHTDLPYGKGLPMLAKDFEIAKKGSVILRFSSLGCCDIYINGKRVGKDEMKTGWTNYNVRSLYMDYDISDYVSQGSNRILAVLSGGWYSGRIVGDYYGANPPAFIASITNDGECVAVTDESWKALLGGQIRIADIWDGELRDGTLDGYDIISETGYNTAEWKNAEIAEYAQGKLTEFIGPTVQVRENISRKPAVITIYNGINYNGTNYGEVNTIESNGSLPVSLKKGQTLIVDLGQEIVGWAKLRIKGEKGTTVKMRYAEFLNDSGDISRGNDGAKGSVYTINLRSALGKAYYILNGNGEEVYRPTFTFFGFRYVEITAENDIELLDFTGEVVGNVTEEIGKLETSDEMVNKLISNTLWGQRGNYLSVPTDCPQRDERFGWTGDAQAFSITAAYNANVLGFFRKWMQDARDSQSDEGAYSDIMPRSYCCTSENAAAWGDAGIIVPYNMYRMYGDTEILKEHYASMEKYIAQLVDNYGLTGPIPRYGDWLSYDYCKNEMISSAMLVFDTDIMTEVSEVLGKSDRAEFYKELNAKARGYYKETFLSDGQLIGQTQTDKVLALRYNLLDDCTAEKTADALEQQIKDNDNRLSTGFVGTYNLCPTLSKFGKDKIAYTLLMQRKEPSWLYSIDQGATTIWERWNSYTKENGFGDVGMNSFNHYAYGSIVEWIYRFAAGIEPDEAGFRSFILQPRIDTRTADELPDGQQNMKWIKAEYNSASGLIKSAWSTENGFVYECTVPNEASATLYLPLFGKKFTINGIEHSADEYEQKNNCAVIRLGAGEYVFEEV